MSKKKKTLLFCIIFILVIVTLVFICNILQIDSKVSPYLGGAAGVLIANLWRKTGEDDH